MKWMLQVHRYKRIVLLFTRTSKVVKIAFQNVESHNSTLSACPLRSRVSAELLLGRSGWNCRANSQNWQTRSIPPSSQRWKRSGLLSLSSCLARSSLSYGGLLSLSSLSHLVQLAPCLSLSLSLATGSGFCHCCLALCLSLVMFAFLCMHVCFWRLGFQ